MNQCITCHKIFTPHEFILIAYFSDKTEIYHPYFSCFCSYDKETFTPSMNDILNLTKKINDCIGLTIIRNNKLLSRLIIPFNQLDKKQQIQLKQYATIYKQLHICNECHKSFAPFINSYDSGIITVYDNNTVIFHHISCFHNMSSDHIVGYIRANDMYYEYFYSTDQINNNIINMLICSYEKIIEYDKNTQHIFDKNKQITMKKQNDNLDFMKKQVKCAYCYKQLMFFCGMIKASINKNVYDLFHEHCFYKHLKYINVDKYMSIDTICYKFINKNTITKESKLCCDRITPLYI